MTWIIDIVLVLIVAVAGYVGFRRGIVKMLLSFLTVVVALALAFVLSAPASQGAYDMFFAESVNRTVDAAFEDAAVQTAERAVEKLLGADTVIGGLGRLLAFDTNKAVQKVAGQTMTDAANTVKNDIIRPPMVLLLRVLCFILLFVLLWIVLALICIGLVHTADLPVIKGINAAAGALVGVVVGVLLSLGVCGLFNLSTQINPNGLFGVTEITRENSLIYYYLSEALRAVFR